MVVYRESTREQQQGVGDLIDLWPLNPDTAVRDLVRSSLDRETRGEGLSCSKSVQKGTLFKALLGDVDKP